MVVNWREKKECGHDAKEGADKDSIYISVPLKSVGLNLLRMGLWGVGKEQNLWGRSGYCIRSWPIFGFYTKPNSKVLFL